MPDDSPEVRESSCGVILLYHRVAEPDTDVHGLCTAPSEFRAQMAHLHADYNVLPLQDLTDAVLSGRTPGRAVAITFDDGYADNYSTALPILAEIGLSATFFVTTDRLHDDYEYWWDALERIFIAPGPPLPSVLHLNLPDQSVSFGTATTDQRLTAHWSVYRALVEGPTVVRDETIAALTSWSGRMFAPASTHRRMRAEEVAQLRQAGHVIGAHSVRHLMLPHQPIAVQRIEVQESRSSLETLLGQPVTLFAYPFGGLNERTQAIVGESFDLAVSCGEEVLTKESDRWCLPRLEVRPHRSASFGEWLRRWLPPA
jgi:peptidoglycan/xylan/chitin deacetylase (PgdA/CDA1 family)